MLPYHKDLIKQIIIYKTVVPPIDKSKDSYLFKIYDVSNTVSFVS